MDVYWYLVPRDGYYPWSAAGARKIDFGYIRQLATAVDYLGFTGALLATGGGAHDAWVMGAALIPLTKQMKFIIAVHPGIVAPLMLAQKAATFDQFSDGRLILNIITGESHQMPPYGIYEEHDDRYRMTDEYWTLYRRLIAGERVDFKGEFFSLRGAELSLEPARLARTRARCGLCRSRCGTARARRSATSCAGGRMTAVGDTGDFFLAAWPSGKA